MNKEREIQSALQPKAPHPVRQFVRLREVLLLFAVALGSGIAILAAQDTRTLLGNTQVPSYQAYEPVITAFHTGPFTYKNVLQLQPGVTAGDQSYDAIFIDPVVPAAVTALAAESARVGKEIVLYWTLPEGSESVNVYRRQVSQTADQEKQIAHLLNNTTLTDADVDNGVEYVYRVATVNIVNEVEYESTPAPTVSAVASDSIAPTAPAQVLIVSQNAPAEPGVLLTWKLVDAADVAQIVLYRSSAYGTRGAEIGRVAATDPQQFLDKGVEPNAVVYYTLVAIDAAGNQSTVDRQLPRAGNPQPFSPIGVTPAQ